MPNTPEKPLFQAKSLTLLAVLVGSLREGGKPAGLLFEYFSSSLFTQFGDNSVFDLAKMRDLKIPFVSIEALKPPGVISRMAAACNILARPPKNHPGK